MIARFSITRRIWLPVAALALLVGCNESDILVGRDEDAPPQILIISRDLATDPRGDSEEAADVFPPSDDVDPARILWVQTYATDHGGYTYESARAGFWAWFAGEDRSAEFEQVSLGGTSLPLLDSNCKATSYSSDDGMCWVVEHQGIPLKVFAGDGKISDFTDRPTFRAEGDVRLADVAVRPNIPASNRMLNVRPGDQVSANGHWSIELQYPVNGASVFIRPAHEDHGSYAKQIGEESNLLVSVEGVADRVVIPAAELDRLYDAGARELWVSLYVNPALNPVDSISLDTRDGSVGIDVTVALSSFHNVWEVHLVK